MTKLFYITGCQRSGTTLMKLVLESHSDIACLDEETAYQLLPQIAKEGAPAVSQLTTKRNLGLKIPRFAEQFLEPEVRDIDYGRFKNFYRSDPVIFMIRDVRDVISSMRSLVYPDGQSWLKKYGLPILLFNLQQTSKANRYVSDMKLVEDESFSDCTVGALYWKFKTEVIFDYLDQGLDLLPVVYETFVSDPKNILENIVRFLGIPWEESLLNHPRYDHGDLDQKGLSIGGTDPKRAIHGQSIGVYRYGLSVSELEQIELIAGKTRDRIIKILSYA